MMNVNVHLNTLEITNLKFVVRAKIQSKDNSKIGKFTF